VKKESGGDGHYLPGRRHASCGGARVVMVVV